MSAYAILGATGNTGSCLLDILSRNAEHKIHVLVRSKAKLQKQVPDILSQPHIHVFEGSISDASTLTACLTGVRAVFLTIGAPDNVPGCTLMQDTTKAVINALGTIQQQQPATKLPRLLLLSTSTIDPVFNKSLPKPMLRVLLAATSHVVNDLRLAEDYLRAQAEEMRLSVTYIKPGGLVHDSAKGHVLSTERQQTFLSFMDLAGGMIEVADEEGDRWDGKNVSVLPKSKTRIEWRGPYFMVKGLLYHFFPAVYPYLNP